MKSGQGKKGGTSFFPFLSTGRRGTLGTCQTSPYIDRLVALKENRFTLAILVEVMQLTY